MPGARDEPATSYNAETLARTAVTGVGVVHAMAATSSFVKASTCLMRITYGSGMLALLVGAKLWAQAPAGAVTIENKLDTPQARVYVATLAPHAPVPSRTGHATDRVLVYLDSGLMTRREGSGEAQRIPFRRGEVRWRPASGAYVAENIGDQPIRILEIDLKGKPGGPMPTTKLDPPVVDAQHYTVEFENDAVRVLRVRYGPREKGALHEHILNRVVVYLNDQPNAKADTVRMAGAATHTEENASDQPAERIAIELK